MMISMSLPLPWISLGMKGHMDLLCQRGRLCGWMSRRDWGLPKAAACLAWALASVCVVCFIFPLDIFSCNNSIFGRESSCREVLSLYSRSFCDFVQLWWWDLLFAALGRLLVLEAPGLLTEAAAAQLGFGRGRRDQTRAPQRLPAGLQTSLQGLSNRCRFSADQTQSYLTYPCYLHQKYRTKTGNLKLPC